MHLFLGSQPTDVVSLLFLDDFGEAWKSHEGQRNIESSHRGHRRLAWLRFAQLLLLLGVYHWVRLENVGTKWWFPKMVVPNNHWFSY